MENSFTLRVVNTWNSLPTKVITSKTMNTLKKKRLDKHWSDQKLLYDHFIAQITVTGSDAVYLEAESHEGALGTCRKSTTCNYKYS